MDKKLYIAYGSNLNIPQMEIRCPKAKVFGTAFINDYELLFKGSEDGVYLTIEPKIDSKVPVTVWEVTESDEIALDDYEGYPYLYYKKDMTLDIEDIDTKELKKVDAFVYIMHEDLKLGMPSDDYLRDCLEGYKVFKFDEKYIYDALAISKNIKS